MSKSQGNVVDPDVVVKGDEVVVDDIVLSINILIH